MVDAEIVVGRVRRAGWRHVGFGLHRLDRPGGSPREDLRAWQRVLPGNSVFTHLTAAREHGLWLPTLPGDMPTFVAVQRLQNRARRPELRVIRQARPAEPVVVGGVRLAPPAEAILDCARDLGLLDLVVLVDSALHLGRCTPRDLQAATEKDRWGAPALRRALRHADGRAESPWESVLRMFHQVCHVQVEPQHPVHDEEGRFIARGDLRIVGSRVLHEYDGAVHRDRAQHAHDLARERAIGGAGWVRRGYTSTDLLARAHVVLREADKTLGRPHDPTRLEPWYAALRESSLSATGRARLRRRWRLPESGPSVRVPVEEPRRG